MEARALNELQVKCPPMLIGLKLLKRCIVAIEMADGDGSFLTALVIGVNNSLRRH